jgi:hypothetical protein
MATDTEAIKNWFRQPYGGTLFKNKDFLWITDQNSNSYDNQPVMFDTQSSTNIDAFFQWSEGFVYLPLLIYGQTLQGGDGAGARAASQAPSPYNFGFKNGWYQIVDHIQLQINDATVTNALPYLNILCHLRVLTSFTPSALELVGPSYNLALDTCDSFQCIRAGTTDNTQGTITDDTYINNIAIPTTSTGVNTALYPAPAGSTAGMASGQRSIVNEGFYNRCKWQNRAMLAGDLGGLHKPLRSSYLAPAITNTDGASTIGRPIAGLHPFGYYIAIIPLKLLHDVFTQMNMPLKRIRVRLNLYLNLVTPTALTADSATASHFKVKSSTIGGGTALLTSTDMNTASSLAFAGQCNPLMIGQHGAFSGAAGQLGGGAIAALGCRVAYGTGAGVTSDQLTPCRLYLPVVEPFAYQLQKVIPWSRHISYWDHQIFKQTTGGTSNGLGFDWLVTPGLPNARRLWLIARPYTASISSDTAVYGSNDPLLRYSCTEPGTGSWGAFLQNINMYIGPNTVWRNRIEYTYEMFLNQFADAMPNNMADRVIAPGLINKYMFETSYPIYCVNLVRMARTWALNEAPQIRITGNTMTPYPVQFLCIIEYERVLTIGMIDKTGASVAG